MAAQSGITPTSELTSEWEQFQGNAEQRVFKISIKDEQLQPAGTWKVQGEGVEEVFKLFEGVEVAEDKTPAYFVVRLASTTASSDSYLFISYVPDHAPVRAKMLYASSRQTLVRSLGDSKLKDSIFATSKDDLTYSSYLAHTRHSNASAPLTAREQEMASIRAAEKAAAQDDDPASSGQGRSMIFGDSSNGDHENEGEEGGSKEVRGALPWSQEAKDAVRRLKEDAASIEVVQLEIDLKTETIVLSDSQPSGLELPKDKPCYLFYRHEAGIVLIYSCPPTSPIKSRLVYSSAVLVFYKYAAKEYAGVDVLKKLETDDPSEVNPAWVTSELGPLASTSTSSDPTSAGASSGNSTPGGGGSGGNAPMPKEEKGFARPTRPGRRR